VEASLKRLDTTYIDLLQIRGIDTETPVAGTMRALHDLVVSGKVRCIGASSMRAWRFAEMNHVAEMNGSTQFASMQFEHSLLQREAEREVIPYCRAKGIGLIPYSPLAFKILTRSVEETEALLAEGVPKLTDADKIIIGRVQAEKARCTMAQVTLAWVRHKTDSPVVEMTSVARVEQNTEHLQLSPETSNIWRSRGKVSPQGRP